MKTGATAAAVLCCGCSLFIKKRDPDMTLKAVGGKVRVPDRQLSESLVLDIKDEGKILLFRRPDCSVHAVSITCTHMGCDVEYAKDQDLIKCPCHGSKYDTKGANLKGPAKKPLRVYAVSRATSPAGSDIVVRVT